MERIWTSHIDYASEKPGDNIKELIFSRVQRIMQRPWESSEDLHERLREQIRNSFIAVQEITKIITPSWYTFDTNHILWENTFALSTSTCKHEMPTIILVGKRDNHFMRKLEDWRFEYIIYPLGREITQEEKDRIYDEM